MRHLRCQFLFLIALVILPSVGWSPLQAAGLTFEERVEAQRAVERVYWRHRIWPADNPGGKPALDAVLPESVLRSRV